MGLVKVLKCLVIHFAAKLVKENKNLRLLKNNIFKDPEKGKRHLFIKLILSKTPFCVYPVHHWL